MEIYSILNLAAKLKISHVIGNMIKLSSYYIISIKFVIYLVEYWIRIDNICVNSSATIISTHLVQKCISVNLVNGNSVSSGLPVIQNLFSSQTPKNVPDLPEF